MQTELAAKENAIKPTPPAIPNDVVAQMHIENSPRRRRKIVRSKTKHEKSIAIAMRMARIHGRYRQRNSTGNASATLRSYIHRSSKERQVGSLAHHELELFESIIQQR